MSKIKLKAIVNGLTTIASLQVKLNTLDKIGVSIEGLDTTDALINITALLVINPKSLNDDLYNEVVDTICEWVYETVEDVPTSHIDVFARLLVAQYENR